MKRSRFITLLCAGLIIVTTTSSCRKGVKGLTPLGPGQRGTGTQNVRPAPPMDSGNPVPVDPGANAVRPGDPIVTSDFLIDEMNQDRTSFQANTVYFDFDSSVVKQNEIEKLDTVATYLKRSPQNKLLLEGHCDERGTEEYNRSLGERRALALRESLAQMGVDPARVKTLSWGEDKPAAPGHDGAAWSKNRRGEFILLHPR